MSFQDQAGPPLCCFQKREKVWRQALSPAESRRCALPPPLLPVVADERRWTHMHPFSPPAAPSPMAVTVMCSEFRYNVTKFVTKSDGTFLGCCAGQDGPARSVPSVSHDGTDPPNVTFEARLPTFTLPLILSGRLSQLGRWEA